jgi:polar amino acid transport system substrate-binding protein
VVDLPTADYVTNVEMENGAIVGQFATPEGQAQEYLSLVLEKDSPLTACVNQALASLRDDGTLQALAEEHIPNISGTPFFE